MIEWVEQQICIKFCIKLELSSMETIQMIQKTTGMGNWWLAASSGQCTHSCITSYAEFFGKTSNCPGESAPLQPIFGTLQLLAFPKAKITFEREEISDYQWDSEKIWWGSWWRLGELCEVPRCLVWRGLRHHCPMYVFLLCMYMEVALTYLVSSSINVSMFDVTCLDTFWTNLICCVQETHLRTKKHI